MADQQASRGRARGRGRGSQQQAPGAQVTQQMQQMSLGASPGQSVGGDNGDNGNGNGNGSAAAMRGRGGYRSFDPHTRPQTAAVGNKGNPIQLIANYFRMQTNPNLHIYQYHVSFEPSEFERRLKRKMIYDHRELFNETYIYDGEATLFTLNDAGEENEFVEQLPEANIRVVIKRTTEVTQDPRQSIEMIRIYNTQMRKFMARYLKLVQIRQYMYSPHQKVDIPQYNISIWPGNVTAINRHDGGILVCVDPIYKVVRTDNVLNFLKKVREEKPQQFKEEAIKQLTCTSVMTAYNNKSYRIDDIDWKGRPSHTMPEDSRTYIDYYRERYNVTISDPNQPLLIVKQSIRDALRQSRRTQEEHQKPRPILLVPELCLMTGLSESMMNDFQLKKSMSQHTRPDPGQRVNTIKRFMQSLAGNAEVQKDMELWGTRYAPENVQVTGRILPPEVILGRGETGPNASSYRYDHKTDDFIAQIRSKPLRTTANLGNWVIIATERDRENVDQLANTMRKVCQGMQIGVNRPMVKLVPNPQTRTFVEECRRVDPKTDMVVVLSPDNKADRYSAIKKLYCCEMGVLSQVVLAKNVRSKGFMSICTKVALQIACKLGAEPWCMHIPMGGIMVVGFDTYHDTQAAGGPRRSVGGFVSSLNNDLSKWYSRVNYHQSAQELSQHFCQNMTAALNAYITENKKTPAWIVVYRDGVGEGQIEEVHKTERLDIEKVVKKASTGIQLTFIVISKRINTRLFFPRENQCLNPPPGTVVDTIITRPSRYEFYLVSQSVRQGTVAPTSFNIIHDDSNKGPNIHQMLAYKMTHMYYNWPGTIRVPAPCQYAHKLAFLTGTALHKEPHARLHNKLFYL